MRSARTGACDRDGIKMLITIKSDQRLRRRRDRCTISFEMVPPPSLWYTHAFQSSMCGFGNVLATLGELDLREPYTEAPVSNVPETLYRGQLIESPRPSSSPAATHNHHSIINNQSSPLSAHPISFARNHVGAHNLFSISTLSTGCLPGAELQSSSSSSSASETTTLTTHRRRTVEFAQPAIITNIFAGKRVSARSENRITHSPASEEACACTALLRLETFPHPPSVHAQCQRSSACVRVLVCVRRHVRP